LFLLFGTTVAMCLTVPSENTLKISKLRRSLKTYFSLLSVVACSPALNCLCVAFR
jgi:hypothetical protein